MLIRSAALAAIAAVSLPFAAAAETRQPVSATVSTRGLDLSTAEGRAKLHRRVTAAIGATCNDRPAIQTMRTNQTRDARCFAELRDDANAKLAAIDSRHPTVLVTDTSGSH